MGLRKWDGFVLTSESPPFWYRRDRTVFILSSEIEAAARLALRMDFDVRSFDAFCHCVEYSPFTLKKDSPSPAKEGSPQYNALCDWILAQCRKLIEPPILKSNRMALYPSHHWPSQSIESDEVTVDIEGVQPDSRYGGDARELFMYFRLQVSRARIWQDHGQALFLRLKAVASEYMEQIAPMCDARFEDLCLESNAADLLNFGCSFGGENLQISETSLSTAAELKRALPKPREIKLDTQASSSHSVR